MTPRYSPGGNKLSREYEDYQKTAHKRKLRAERLCVCCGICEWPGCHWPHTPLFPLTMHHLHYDKRLMDMTVDDVRMYCHEHHPMADEQRQAQADLDLRWRRIFGLARSWHGENWREKITEEQAIEEWEAMEERNVREDQLRKEREERRKNQNPDP